MSAGTHLSSEVRHRAAMAVMEDMPIVDVAAAYRVNRKTVARWVSRFEDEGRAGLNRKSGSGRPRILEELSEDELCRIVLRGALTFGYETDLWTVGRLRRVIADEFEIQLSKNTIWRRLEAVVESRRLIAARSFLVNANGTFFMGRAIPLPEFLVAAPCELVPSWATPVRTTLLLGTHRVPKQ